MSANYQILNKKNIDAFYWIPPTDITYIAGQPLLPIHAGELGPASSTMPLAFAELDGQWQLVAVAGLQPQHNLFVHNGQWLGRYQPRYVNSYDFDMQIVGNLAFLRFNVNGKLSATPEQQGAVPMMTAEGELSPAVQAIQDQLQKDSPLFARTQAAVQALADAGVLRAWPTALAEQVGMKLSGLYCLDEAALAKLSDANFLTLRQAQAIGMAYAVNFSLQQSHLLVRLQRHNPAVDTAADVDSLFGQNGDDTIRFDF